MKQLTKEEEHEQDRQEKEKQRKKSQLSQNNTQILIHDAEEIKISPDNKPFGKSSNLG